MHGRPGRSDRTIAKPSRRILLTRAPRPCAEDGTLVVDAVSLSVHDTVPLADRIGMFDTSVCVMLGGLRREEPYRSHDRPRTTHDLAPETSPSVATSEQTLNRSSVRKAGSDRARPVSHDPSPGHAVMSPNRYTTGSNDFRLDCLEDCNGVYAVPTGQRPLGADRFGTAVHPRLPTTEETLCDGRHPNQLAPRSAKRVLSRPASARSARMGSRDAP